MSVVLFFGFTILVVLFGLAFVAVTLHHHWKVDRLAKQAAKKT